MCNSDPAFDIPRVMHVLRVLNCCVHFIFTIRAKKKSTKKFIPCKKNLAKKYSFLEIAIESKLRWNEKRSAVVQIDVIFIENHRYQFPKTQKLANPQNKIATNISCHMELLQHRYIVVNISGLRIADFFQFIHVISLMIEVCSSVVGRVKRC